VFHILQLFAGIKETVGYRGVTGKDRN